MKLTVALAAAVLVSAAPMAAAAQPTTDPGAISGGAYALDKNHARLQATVGHLGYSNYVMRFDGFDATLTWDGRNPASSKIEVTADPNTVNTGLENFDKEVGGQFLGGTPVRFVSTSAQSTGANTGRLTGDLTLNGVTRPATFDVRLVGAGPHPFSGKPTVGFAATTKIKRSDYKVAPSLPAAILGDEVTIQFDGEFNKN